MPFPDCIQTKLNFFACKSQAEIYPFGMEAEFDPVELARHLYAFRSRIGFELTDQGGLPSYLTVPLWQALSNVQTAIKELEERFSCSEENLIDLGRGKDFGQPEQ